MIIKKDNIYDLNNIGRPAEASGGLLVSYIQETDAKVAGGRKSPGLLILPGGGYSWISPREAEPVALRFFAKGYHVFVLTYSCAPARFPVALRETYAAVKHIRSQSEEIGLDENMLAVLGFSAGGHLAITAATLFDAPEVSDIGSAGELRPDLLLLSYPVAISHGKTHEGSFKNLCGDDEKLRERLSADRLARTDMPPVYLWATRDDGSVPVRNSLLFAAAAEEAGVDLSIHIFRHGAHGLATADIMTFPSMYLPDKSTGVENWIDEMLSFAEEKGFCIKDLSGSPRQ